VKGTFRWTTPPCARCEHGGRRQRPGSARVAALCLSGNASGPGQDRNNLDIQAAPDQLHAVDDRNTQVTGTLGLLEERTPWSSAAAPPARQQRHRQPQVQENTAQVTIGGSGFGNTAGGNIQVNKNNVAARSPRTRARGHCDLKDNHTRHRGQANHGDRQEHLPWNGYPDERRTVPRNRSERGGERHPAVHRPVGREVWETRGSVRPNRAAAARRPLHFAAPRAFPFISKPTAEPEPVPVPAPAPTPARAPPARPRRSKTHPQHTR